MYPLIIEKLLSDIERFITDFCPRKAQREFEKECIRLDREKGKSPEHYYRKILSIIESICSRLKLKKIQDGLNVFIGKLKTEIENEKEPELEQKIKDLIEYPVLIIFFSGNSYFNKFPKERFRRDKDYDILADTIIRKYPLVLDVVQEYDNIFTLENIKTALRIKGIFIRYLNLEKYSEEEVKELSEIALRNDLSVLNYIPFLIKKEVFRKVCSEKILESDLELDCWLQKFCPVNSKLNGELEGELKSLE